MRCGSPTFLIVIDLLTAVLSLMLGHLFTLDETWPLSSTVGPGGSTLILFAVLVIFSSHFCEIYRWENSFGEVDFV
ncbi:MAG: hypothetical protein PF495_14930, partial [Spirochaetales bacterium]|nr:hypothetical protein [Spirochaetales bacterium]